MSINVYQMSIKCLSMSINVKLHDAHNNLAG
jgi:hypothetical protein